MCVAYGNPSSSVWPVTVLLWGQVLSPELTQDHLMQLIPIARGSQGIMGNYNCPSSCWTNPQLPVKAHNEKLMCLKSENAPFSICVLYIESESRPERAVRGPSAGNQSIENDSEIWEPTAASTESEPPS